MNNLGLTLLLILLGWAFFHGGQAMVNEVTMMFGAAMASVTVAAVQVSGIAANIRQLVLRFSTRCLEVAVKVGDLLLVWKEFSFHQACLFFRYRSLNKKAFVLSDGSIRSIHLGFDDFLEEVKSTAYERDDWQLSDEQALDFIEGNLIKRRMADGLQEETHFNGH